MKNYIAAWILALAPVLAYTQDAHVQDYINLYKEIAIGEMHRTGIPASIKLAQGILESDAGRSELAKESNNHFGIKCGPIWEGDTYYKKDDDRDRKGRLIKSCFRVFIDPAESYAEHSNFLMNPNKAYRYGFLFTLDRYDYKSWAWGLKESGYATNPRYAVLLISIIERYELYSLDYYEPTSHMVAVRKPAPPKPQAKPRYEQEVLQPKVITASWKKTHGTEKVKVIRGKVRNNGLSLVYAELGDTPEKLAMRYKVLAEDILTFNEGIFKGDQVLQATERVYLEEKKKKYGGATLAHTVLEGETIYEISQIYGVKLDRLLKRNRMTWGEEPRAGERISLRKKVKKKDRPRLRDDRLVQHPAPARLPAISDSHVVQKGETLYSIAKKYQVTIDDIKLLNELESSLIFPGQVLAIDQAP